MAEIFRSETFRSCGEGKHDMGQIVVVGPDGARLNVVRRTHGVRNVAALRAEADALNAAVSAERERCARIVESYANTDPDRAIAAAAAEIRGAK